MQQNDRRVILMILLSVILFIAGIYLYDPVAEFLLPRINGVTYRPTENKSTFHNTFLFALSLALVPLCILVAWAIGRAGTGKERVAISSIILVITILTVFARQQILYSYLKKVTEDSPPGSADFDIEHSLNGTGFELYLLAGVLGACIITCLIYRRKN